MVTPSSNQDLKSVENTPVSYVTGYFYDKPGKLLDALALIKNWTVTFFSFSEQHRANLDKFELGLKHLSFFDKAIKLPKSFWKYLGQVERFREKTVNYLLGRNHSYKSDNATGEFIEGTADTVYAVAELGEGFVKLFYRTMLYSVPYIHGIGSVMCLGTSMKHFITGLDKAVQLQKEDYANPEMKVRKDDRLFLEIVKRTASIGLSVMGIAGVFTPAPFMGILVCWTTCSIMNALISMHDKAYGTLNENYGRLDPNRVSILASSA